MGVLYKLDFPSGKSYIGFTMKTLDERLQRHFYEADLGLNSARHRAIRKYGKERVVASVLIESQDEKFLKLKEQEAILKFNTKGPNGYNMTDGGEGACGLIVSASSKKKMSLAKLGKKQTRQHIEARSKGMIGMKRSEEFKARMREISKGRTFPKSAVENSVATRKAKAEAKRGGCK